jgi:spermidine synthase
MLTTFSRWRAWWDALHAEHGDALDRIPPAWTRAAVVAASALTLYVEMVMVRWHASCFHAFAIFKNVSLLSCFLGLGIGYGLSGRRRSTLGAFLPLLALQALLFGLLSHTNLGGRRINPVAEQLVMGTSGGKWGWLDLAEGNAFLAAVFTVNALMFVPLGQLAGRLMTRLPKVEGYSLNLLGSLAGIAVFFLLSLAWTPPAVWMGVAVLAAAPFLAGPRRLAAVAAASLAVILVALGLMARTGEQTFYSPYQVITLQLPDPAGRVRVPTIKVNHAFFQDVVDCSGRQGGADAATVAYYDLPYRLRPRPGDVLVVGAGSGNDVAAALRHGARAVTAVEIDPTILYLGRCVHPERPYQDPRTRPVLNDARSFLRQTDERFDTIVYGLLDSHTNLGTMTNVRLDSFVYTVEGFRDAVARLKDDGLLVVSYLVLDQRQGAKLYAMLRAACPGKEPRVFHAERGVTFVTGPGLDRVPAAVAGVAEQTAWMRESAAHAEVATDDWPFFYMQRRTYPVTYAVMILFLLALSAWIMRRQLRPRPGEEPAGSSGHPVTWSPGHLVFFFLGAGFMLVETKGVTELGLVFGNTWSVLAVVVSGILVMVYLANQWVLRRGPVPHGGSFALLGAALLLGWGVTWLGGAGVVVPLPRLVMPVVLTLPLFFAGLIFSSELARRGDLGAALSANLFGAMLGGFLEYNSMYWGFSSLYPLGMALYGLAYGCAWYAGRQAARSEGGAGEAPAPAARAA